MKKWKWNWKVCVRNLLTLVSTLLLLWLLVSYFDVVIHNVSFEGYDLPEWNAFNIFLKGGEM